MASILCSKCNCGIHYHSEPQGVQYIFISQKDWDIVVNSKFDKSKITKDRNGYPKLYRTDTIEEDFSDKIIKLWRCPNCKSIIIFNKQRGKEQTYITSEKAKPGKQIDEGLLFDDYLWDQITETAKPDIDLKTQAPSFFIKVYENEVIVSVDNLFLNPQYYTEYRR